MSASKKEYKSSQKSQFFFQYSDDDVNNDQIINETTLDSFLVNQIDFLQVCFTEAHYFVLKSNDEQSSLFMRR